MLSVGYIRRPHGLGGDVIVRSNSDDPDRFAVGAEFTTDETPSRMLQIAEVRQHVDGELVRFKQVCDRTAAGQLRGVTLFVSLEQRRKLGSSEFWPEDLVGMTVVDPSGSHLGTVTKVRTDTPQHRLVVATNTEEVEVPFVAALVGQPDFALRTIEVDVPEGLF